MKILDIIVVLGICISITLHLTLKNICFGYTLCSGFGCSRQQKRHAAAPPPARVRRRMETNRQKLVGRDKGSLTEQQTKRTVTTTIQKRGIYKIL